MTYMLSVEISGRFPGVGRSFIERLARRAFAAGGGRGNAAVSIAAVGEAKMRTLNRKYRGKDKVTDVLSFAYPGAPLGDLVICIPQVRRQAKSIGRVFKQELALMVVHGVLHLLGHDHETLKEEKRMFRLQHDILIKAGIL
jgi:probable rRNA maturation factor